MFFSSRTYWILILALASLLRATLSEAAPAFPGAEGFGKNTVGGRGGQVIKVTNLNNSGSGSFRDAVTQSGPRIVVFEVGGTITLSSALNIDNPYLTVAGQTAPGDGIQFAGGAIIIRASEVIFRNVRRRYDGSSNGVDGIAIVSNGPEVSNVILDHCSVSWATDENIGINGASGDVRDVTVQYCIIAEGLTHDAGHSMGLLLNGWKSFSTGPDYVSIYHNLFANNQARNPAIGNGMSVEVVNNVVYNWRTAATTMSNDTRTHYIGNYYKAGPPTVRDDRVIDCVYITDYTDVEMYLEGNIAVTRPDNTYPEYSILSKVEVPGVDPEDVPSANPVLSPMIPNALSASQAVISVLASAGAFPRDSVDQRQVDSFLNDTGAFVYLSGDVGGLPVLVGGTPPVDTDDDGMPDSWETANGHNPNVDDSAGDADSDGYTNVEEYLNSLIYQSSNSAPSVSLTAPSDSALYTSPAAVGLAATATDSDGTVAKVEFFEGSNKLGEDLSAPFTYSWSSVAAGSYSLTAKATDDQGATTDSDSVGILVVSPGTIIDDFEDGNANGWTADGPGTWSVVSSGSDVYRQSVNSVTSTRSTLDQSSSWTDQSIQADLRANSFNGSNRFFGVVARYVDANNYYYFILRSNNTIELKKLINGTSTTLDSESFSVATGNWYTVRLEVIGTSLKAYIDEELMLEWTDSQFSSGKAGLVTFYTAADFDNVLADPNDVADTTAPTVSISSPTNGSTVSDAIGVEANASDNVGVIGVQFKLDGNNLGAEDTTAPYEVSWNTAASSLGSHTLTAVARDAADNSTVSSGVSVTVAPASIIDDFSDGNANGWTADGPGSWSVVMDGSYVYEQSNNSVSSTRSVLNATANWTDQSVEVDVKAISHSGSNRFFGVVARYVDASNYYYFILRSNGTIELKKIINGTAYTLDSASLSVNTGNWYTLKLEASGTSLKAYVDDQLELEATDSEYSSGKVGLLTFYTEAQFADVVADSTP